jgi:hypothetical protein
MKYEKPEIALAASAVEAVKNQSKDDSVNLDMTLVGHTLSAYQSDE